ncbi:glycosyltransferase family 4 protein [Shewanella putrefaciens]|uniref:glycosyltransferase family 4 protein n=1 Tax=Shewanella putrefaciens TaxID=24 RepID=UPI0021C16FA5|nr:glycosyltransferase family 4 protein [Shewanella putrefaciens]UXK09898.1 glycosyltransferase family 4 protein [Shewanella putrefaciens]
MKFTIVNNVLYDYLGTDLMLGGIESYIQELSKLIEELGHEVMIIQMSKVRFEKLLNTSTTVVGYTNSVGKLPSKRAFLNYVKKRIEKSIVIWGSDQLSTNLKYNKSIIIQHGIGFDCEAFESGLKKYIPTFRLERIYKFLQRYRAIRLFENSHYSVCVDYNFLCWYRTMRPNKTGGNHQVIPNFTRISKENIKKRKEDEKINIVFARRFVTRRGIDIFLPAISKVMKQRKNVHVTFAGGGGRIKEVEYFCQQHPNASISSYTYNESIDFHSKFDISVVPSVGSEGTSLSLLEAMSAGCAIISTNVGGLTNIVIDNYNGLLINPNVDELYFAIINLVDNEDLREKLSINASEMVKCSFSLQLWRTRWEKMINLVLESKPIL